MKKTAAVSSDADRQTGVLYIGVDFGTSRTAVAASNGVREGAYRIMCFRQIFGNLNNT